MRFFSNKKIKQIIMLSIKKYCVFINTNKNIFNMTLLEKEF